MAETTGISWCDATWNPWRGCKKISPGCAKCYAERDAKRYGQDFRSVVRSKTTFDNPLKWWIGRKMQKNARIFTCSISDFFIKDADGWRGDAWQIIRNTPFIYLILTKRIERVPQCLPNDWGNGYENVWLGTSAENQKYADERIPLLLSIPAVVHFVSAEPLLGPIDLQLEGRNYGDPSKGEYLDWVITGGESVSDRKSEIEWFRSLRSQCHRATVPFFFKQFGGNKKVNGVWGGNVLDGETYEQFPDMFTV